MTKKIIAMMLAVLMIATIMCGCNKKDENPSDTTPTVTNPSDTGNTPDEPSTPTTPDNPAPSETFPALRVSMNDAVEKIITFGNEGKELFVYANDKWYYIKDTGDKLEESIFTDASNGYDLMADRYGMAHLVNADGKICIPTSGDFEFTFPADDVDAYIYQETTGMLYIFRRNMLTDQFMTEDGNLGERYFDEIFHMQLKANKDANTQNSTDTFYGINYMILQADGDLIAFLNTNGENVFYNLGHYETVFDDVNDLDELVICSTKGYDSVFIEQVAEVRATNYGNIFVRTTDDNYYYYTYTDNVYKVNMPSRQTVMDIKEIYAVGDTSALIIFEDNSIYRLDCTDSGTTMTLQEELTKMYKDGEIVSFAVFENEICFLGKDKVIYKAVKN